MAEIADIGAVRAELVAHGNPAEVGTWWIGHDGWIGHDPNDQHRAVVECAYGLAVAYAVHQPWFAWIDDDGRERHGVVERLPVEEVPSARAEELRATVFAVLDAYARLRSNDGPYDDRAETIAVRHAAYQEALRGKRSDEAGLWILRIPRIAPETRRPLDQAFLDPIRVEHDARIAGDAAFVDATAVRGRRDDVTAFALFDLPGFFCTASDGSWRSPIMLEPVTPLDPQTVAMLDERRAARAAAKRQLDALTARLRI